MLTFSPAVGMSLKTYDEPLLFHSRRMVHVASSSVVISTMNLSSSHAPDAAPLPL